MTEQRATESDTAPVLDGTDVSADPAELAAAALDAAGRWQRRAESPLSSRAVSDAARLVVRSCEGILAQLPRP